MMKTLTLPVALSLLAYVAEPALMSRLSSREFAEFDYSSTFDAPKSPTPAEPQPTPATEVIGPDDWPREKTEPLETDLRPEPPIQELPEPVDAKPKSPEPLVSLRTEQVPQLIILSGCAWDQRDERGNFNSECVPCNAANTAALSMQEKQPAWSVGTDEWCDIRIVDINSREGRQIDLEMGGGTHSLTERYGHEATGKWTPLTPMLVARHPDRDPKIVSGWQGGAPRSADAYWYLAELLGVSRDRPETWGGYDDSAYSPVGVGISSWVRDGGVARAQGWGATVRVGDLIDLFTDASGRREIAPGVTLVVPKKFRFRFVPGDVPTIGFSEAPVVEYQFGFLKRQTRLSKIEIAEDCSSVLLKADGYKAGFKITIDQSRGSE